MYSGFWALVQYTSYVLGGRKHCICMSTSNWNLIIKRMYRKRRKSKQPLFILTRSRLGGVGSQAPADGESGGGVLGWRSFDFRQRTSSNDSSAHLCHLRRAHLLQPQKRCPSRTQGINSSFRTMPVFLYKNFGKYLF